MNFIPVRSVSQLMDLSKRKQVRCFIQLYYGARSTKRIRYNPDKGLFRIINEIDGSRQELTATELMNNRLTNIGQAIIAGALYQDTA